MVVISTTDMEYGKMLLRQGLLETIEEYWDDIVRWLQENYSHMDTRDGGVSFYKNYIENDPEMQAFFFHMYVRPKIAKPRMFTTNEDKISIVVEEAGSREGHICMITGAKRSGKTATAYRIAESIKAKYGRGVWWYGPPATIPDFIDGHSMDINNIPQGSLVLIDEASIQFFSRERGMTQNEFIKTLPVLAHGNRSLIVISQSSAITDLQFIRLCDSIIFKRASVFSLQTERFRVGEVMQFFMPTKPEDSLFFSNSYIIRFSTELPAWWGDAYSKPYSKFRDDTEKYLFIAEMLLDLGSGEDSRKKIIQQLGIRGTRMPDGELTMIMELIDYMGGPGAVLRSDAGYVTETIRNGWNDAPVQAYFLKDGLKFVRGDFRDSPLAEEAMRRLQGEDALFAIRSGICKNEQFYQELLWRINNPDRKNTISILIVGWGRKGTGKSYAGLALFELIYQMYGKPAVKENMVFTANEMVMRLQKLEQKDVLFKDEVAAETTGVGAGRVAQDIQNADATLRGSEINFIRCYPTTPHQFGATADIILLPAGIDAKLGLCKLLLYRGLETYPRRPLGYITIALPSKPLLAYYEKLKHEYMKDIKAGAIGRKKQLEAMAREIASDPDYQGLGNNRERAAFINFRYPGKGISEVEEAIALASLIIKGTIDA